MFGPARCLMDGGFGYVMGVDEHVESGKTVLVEAEALLESEFDSWILADA